MTRESWQDVVGEVLRDVRGFVDRLDNDYSWSSWRDAREALQEIDGLTERLQAGSARPDQIEALFAPTGPLQELSQSSGWGERFRDLAQRCDRALEEVEPGR